MAAWPRTLVRDVVLRKCRLLHSCSYLATLQRFCEFVDGLYCVDACFWCGNVAGCAMIRIARVQPHRKSVGMVAICSISEKEREENRDLNLSMSHAVHRCRRTEDWELDSCVLQRWETDTVETSSLSMFAEREKTETGRVIMHRSSRRFPR